LRPEPVLDVPEPPSTRFKVQATIFEHELFAIGVTLLSTAITLSGKSVVTKRGMIWAPGFVVGVIGASVVGSDVYKVFSW
jgi:hypothetical protein